MNFKKSAIAVAVATVAATPIIAAADGSIYASARYGFETKDAGGTSERVNQFKNFGSRFGVKGETDLGNGLTAHGHWETHMFDVANNLRDYKIGVKGGFGNVYMGDGINHAWDTFMTTDATWWHGGQSHLSEGVQSQAITYMGGAGPVSFGATIHMHVQDADATEESVGGYEIAGAFDAGVVNIAVGVSDLEYVLDEHGDALVAGGALVDAEPVIGFVVSGSVGGFGYAVDFQSQDDFDGTAGADATSIQLEGTFGNFAAQYGMRKIDGQSAEQTNLVLSYYHVLGPRTLMYFEFHSADPDTAADSTETIAAVLKYDIL